MTVALCGELIQRTKYYRHTAHSTVVLRALLWKSKTDQPRVRADSTPRKTVRSISHILTDPATAWAWSLRTQHAALDAMALSHSEVQVGLLIKIVVITKHRLCHARDDAGRTSSFRTTWTKGAIRYQEQRHGQLGKFVRISLEPWKRKSRY